MAGVAIALLIPCFWQPHIQAGDLPSHVYNAWLAGQVEQGAIPGLTLVHPTTNVLADWLLRVLSRSIGASWAERLVAAAAVQVFFWGAFAWITAIQNRRPWIVVSFLSMLAYGLIFHFGFLNFYLSTGLTLCIMALLWHPSRRRYFVAVPLAVLAFLAHPLPLVWGIFALAYVAVARRLSDQMRVLLLPTAFSVLILIQTGLTMKFQSQWSVYQFLNAEGLTAIAGAEQFWLYGQVPARGSGGSASLVRSFPGASRSQGHAVGSDRAFMAAEHRRLGAVAGQDRFSWVSTRICLYSAAGIAVYRSFVLRDGQRRTIRAWPDTFFRDCGSGIFHVYVCGS